MGELINLAEYREQKLQSEISEIRAELSWIVQEGSRSPRCTVLLCPSLRRTPILSFQLK